MHATRNHDRIPFTSAVALIAALLVPTGWAHADRYDISLGPQVRVMHSSSMDAITEGEMTLFSMTGAMALDDVKLPFFDRFYVEGVFEAGGVGGPSFQTLHSSASVFSWALGARLSRSVNERLSVQGRANLGVTRIGLTISDQYMDGPTLGDSGYTGTAYLGAASDYIVARRRGRSGDRFSFAVRAELGYLAALPKELRAQPDNAGHEDGAILIPETAASLGDLNLSAVSIRLGIVGRF